MGRMGVSVERDRTAFPYFPDWPHGPPLTLIINLICLVVLSGSAPPSVFFLILLLLFKKNRLFLNKFIIIIICSRHWLSQYLSWEGPLDSSSRTYRQIFTRITVQSSLWLVSVVHNVFVCLSIQSTQRTCSLNFMFIPIKNFLLKQNFLLKSKINFKIIIRKYPFL